MRYELEPNQFALRVYEDDSDSYIAVALIRVQGDRGWMSSVSSPRLFEAFDSFNELLDKIGVKHLEGYMTAAMARAVRIASRGRATYEERGDGVQAGREMVWVKLTRKET